MVFAKQNAGQAHDHGGRRHTAGQPAYVRQDGTDNRMWFLQNKSLGRPRRAYSTSGQSSIWTLSLAPSSATGISSGTIAKPFA